MAASADRLSTSHPPMTSQPGLSLPVPAASPIHARQPLPKPTVRGVGSNVYGVKSAAAVAPDGPRTSTAPTAVTTSIPPSPLSLSSNLAQTVRGDNVTVPYRFPLDHRDATSATLVIKAKHLDSSSAVKRRKIARLERLLRGVMSLSVLDTYGLPYAGAPSRIASSGGRGHVFTVDAGQRQPLPEPPSGPGRLWRPPLRPSPLSWPPTSISNLAATSSSSSTEHRVRTWWQQQQEQQPLAVSPSTSRSLSRPSLQPSRAPPLGATPLSADSAAPNRAKEPPVAAAAAASRPPPPPQPPRPALHLDGPSSLHLAAVLRTRAAAAAATAVTTATATADTAGRTRQRMGAAPGRHKCDPPPSAAPTAASAAMVATAVSATTSAAARMTVAAAAAAAAGAAESVAHLPLSTGCQSPADTPPRRHDTAVQLGAAAAGGVAAAEEDSESAAVVAVEMARLDERHAHFLPSPAPSLSEPLCFGSAAPSTITCTASAVEAVFSVPLRSSTGDIATAAPASPLASTARSAMWVPTAPATEAVASVAAPALAHDGAAAAVAGAGRPGRIMSGRQGAQPQASSLPSVTLGHGMVGGDQFSSSAAGSAAEAPQELPPPPRNGLTSELSWELPRVSEPQLEPQAQSLESPVSTMGETKTADSGEEVGASSRSAALGARVTELQLQLQSQPQPQPQPRSLEPDGSLPASSVSQSAQASSLPLLQPRPARSAMAPPPPPQLQPPMALPARQAGVPAAAAAAAAEGGSSTVPSYSSAAGQVLLQPLPAAATARPPVGGLRKESATASAISLPGSTSAGVAATASVVSPPGGPLSLPPPPLPRPRSLPTHPRPPPPPHLLRSTPPAAPAGAAAAAGEAGGGAVRAVRELLLLHPPRMDAGSAAPAGVAAVAAVVSPSPRDLSAALFSSPSWVHIARLVHTWPHVLNGISVSAAFKALVRCCHPEMLQDADRPDGRALRSMMQHLCFQAEHHLPHMGPREVAGVLYSLASLDFHPPPHLAAQLFGAFGPDPPQPPESDLPLAQGLGQGQGRRRGLTTGASAATAAATAVTVAAPPPPEDNGAGGGARGRERGPGRPVGHPRQGHPLRGAQPQQSTQQQQQQLPRLLGRANALDLAHVAWAAVRLGWRMEAGQLEAAFRRLQTCYRDDGPSLRSLSVFVNSATQLGLLLSQEQLSWLESKLVDQIHGLNCVDVSNAMTSLARLGGDQRRLRRRGPGPEPPSTISATPPAAAAATSCAGVAADATAVAGVAEGVVVLGDVLEEVAAPRGGGVLRPRPETVMAVLWRSAELLPYMRADEAAFILYALARLRFRAPPGYTEALLRRCLAQRNACSPQAVVMMIWASSRLGNRTMGHRPRQPWLAAMLDQAVRHLPSLTPSLLSALLCGLARSGTRRLDPPTCAPFVRRVAELLPYYSSPRDLANTAWALARLPPDCVPTHGSAFWTALGARGAELGFGAFSTQCLANLLWSLSRVVVKRSMGGGAAATTAATAASAARHTAGMLPRKRPSATAAQLLGGSSGLEDLVSALDEHLDDMTESELGMTLWALGKLQADPGVGWVERAARRALGLLPHMHLSSLSCVVHSLTWIKSYEPSEEVCAALEEAVQRRHTLMRGWRLKRGLGSRLMWMRALLRRRRNVRHVEQLTMARRLRLAANYQRVRARAAAVAAARRAAASVAVNQRRKEAGRVQPRRGPPPPPPQQQQQLPQAQTRRQERQQRQPLWQHQWGRQQEGQQAVEKVWQPRQQLHHDDHGQRRRRPDAGHNAMHQPPQLNQLLQETTQGQQQRHYHHHHHHSNHSHPQQHPRQDQEQEEAQQRHQRHQLREDGQHVQGGVSRVLPPGGQQGQHPGRQPQPGTSAQGQQARPAASVWRRRQPHLQPQS